MSVSQVKKRFSEFESFLKKDKEGLRRLKLLKDDVNVLRTSLAAADQKLEIAEVVKNAARERADSAESERDALLLEVHSLRQQVVSLKTNLEAVIRVKQELNQQDSIDEDEDDVIQQPESDDHIKFKKVLNSLRRNLPKCPKLTSKESTRHNPAFIRQELSSGWSHGSIWTLGAAVAIISAHEGAVTIVDPVGINFTHNRLRPAKGIVGSLVRWFGDNFKTNTGPRKEIYFGNKGPAELIDP